MQVIFDATSLCGNGLTGIGIYSKNIHHQLECAPEIELTTVYKATRMHNRHYLKENGVTNAGAYIPYFTDLKFPHGTVFHGPDFDLICTNKYKKIVTIHDLAVFEDGFQDPRFVEKGRRDMTANLMKNPDRIIVDTNFISEKLRQRFPRFNNIIHVVHLGYDIPPYVNNDSMKDQTSFILYVGNIEMRKNVPGILKAFEILAEKEKDLSLILIGRPGYGYDKVMHQLEGMKHRDRVEIRGYQEQKDLSSLYSNALAFLFPSLYEGFGIPVIEAMAHGCPVITSNFGAMLEVSGDAAMHINPLIPDEIADACLEMIRNENTRKRYSKAGQGRAVEYTWEKAAAETIKVYKS